MTQTAGYGSKQVCAIVGVTYRQLDYWDRTDLVKPTLHEAQGSGTKRSYSYRNLLEIKVIKKMLDAGLLLPGIRRAIDYLREEFGDEEEIANANLVIDGNRVLLARSNEELIDIFRGGQGVLSGVYSILAMPQMREEIDSALETIVPDSQRASSDKIVIDLRDKVTASNRS
jgi:DNA-binding transcriptional MerR regulator